ncbi:MAG TPA: T9SS type A sorting domain-containing protein, partial [Adhaeribacter sp.]|nr:T9SS type A sorting domain-containing protein [Adhaeribacter sp.]
VKKLFTFLTAFFIAASSFAQQVPNAGFETWQTKTGVGFMGPYIYDSPQQWEPGFISGLLASFGMKPNIGKSATAGSGNWSLKLTSDADSVGADVQTAFSLAPNFQPQALTGSFRTSGVVTDPNDYGIAFVFMTKWNGVSSDTIGFGTAELDSSPNSFKPFTAQVQYTSPAMPDSARIWLLYFPEGANTHILIDDLALINTLSAKENTKTITRLNLFPNPVHDQATLTFEASQPGNGMLTIRDLTGKEVFTYPLKGLQAGANTVPVLIQSMPAGMYLATVQTETGSQTLRFVKR